MKNLDSLTYSEQQQWKIKIVLFAFLLPLFVISQTTTSLGYRNIKAYTDDFAKNEMYVKKSLMEYSASLIDDQLASRSTTTATRIIQKLKRINTILEKNDVGFEKNTLLRDSFMKMNAKTIESLSNGTLILNDYEVQAANDVATIEKNIEQKEIQLVSYFEELKKYDNSKVEFGIQYNLAANNIVCTNAFEYNGYQNLLFYKMNAIDQKLIASINQINKNDFIECIVLADKIYSEVITKTSIYKGMYTDSSLNTATITFADFIKEQNSQITALFTDFADEYAAFQTIKKQATTTPESIQKYNDSVKVYNSKKNILFDALAVIQYNKKIMYDTWYTTNRNFLKNNTKFDDIHESVTYVD